ncbi:MAG: hypothetical protein PHO83_02605 [Geobacteraceae bacterium]|nr:hypothetical protein [Geobacteraceae bacterium]
MTTTRKILLHFFVISAAIVVLFWGNSLSRQHAQFAKGEQAQARGDVIAAISGYASAIHMYTPGSSLVETAATRLWSLGESCERTGEIERARIAYRSLRSSWYAIRGLTTPGSAWIARCDEKLAKLTADQPPQPNSSTPNKQQ